MEAESSSSESTLAVERVRVPGDNSCLFYAVAYLCEDAEAKPETQKRLRKVVTEIMRSDPDRETRELFLERTIDEYAEWIANEFHEGGEQEVIALAKHYGVKVAVVSTESLTVLTYGEEGRIAYLIYTGTHYDALVGVGKEKKIKLFDTVDADFENKCVAAAKAHNATVLDRNRREKIFRLRCQGCGARFLNSRDFQDHCATFDHDDDFSFECESIFEVEHPQDDDDFNFACSLAKQDLENGPPSGRTRAQRKAIPSLLPATKRLEIHKGISAPHPIPTSSSSSSSDEHSNDSPK